ncbi:bifunctional 4-hydroxy-2-oxoglutarate aldolase/2-dehydro-3-deoxy-phosphogluconate aldolase [Cellulosimicrobium cellulans]|uniref:bifunctional 4-hydroxy-2-oxoglutarate aldolase/2-dehydro-3-deoxy-phosphogluconate aldolase n=1 Tax=Cellulosimicrobium cellulans TaxID=1710 RepID=UPI00130D97A0|nr:bifunctional 4-hydroxy-2-oxoglutarate aldolase/2-dehydro-3-deoxy-phosphogluconate aldolase [Cellulosimicrobium cellulans]
MSVDEQVLAAVRAERLIGIVRAPDAAAGRAALSAMRAAGVRVAEVSLGTPGALDLVAEAADATGGDVIGVGTVLRAADVRSAVAAGARLVVTPALCADVVRTARDLGAIVVPGCATPTEMLEALRLGAHAVKLFPADLWSPGALRTMLRALPQVPVVPTGGVTLGNAGQWLDAGAIAVGMGADLARAGHVADVRRSVAALRRSARPVTTGGAAIPWSG